jgi:hypothetical protein
MFVNNKYLTWYINLIAHAQSRIIQGDVYREKHHIIPKSLGGNNEPDNIVVLTGREHFLVHKLLTKFTTGSYQHKMTHALWRMIGPKDQRDRYRVSAGEYEKIKSENIKALSESHKGKISPAQIAANTRRRGQPAHNKGKPRSRSSIEQMIETRRSKNAGKPIGAKMNLTEEQRAKRRETLAKHSPTAGEERPKFHTILYNTKTHEQLETTHMKKTLASLGVNGRQFYSGNSGWIIKEKWSIKTHKRII